MLPIRPTVCATLLALGAVASVQAQSSVSLYGMVDMSVGQAQAPGGASTGATLRRRAA